MVPMRAQKRKEATHDRLASRLNEFGRLFCCGAVVHDGHKGAGHAGGVAMLNDVAAINDAGGALLDQLFGAFQNFFVGRFAAAAHKHRDTTRDFDNFVINAHVVGRIRLDDVRAGFDRLPHERQDLIEIAVHQVTTGLLVRLKDERLDHQRHGEAVAVGFDPQNVLDALVGDFGLVGDAEEIHDHAGGVKTQRLFDRRLDHATEERARQGGAVNVGHIGAQYQSRSFFAWQRLEKVRLADGQLNGVRSGGNERLDGFLQIFDALQKSAFVEKPVVDGDVEAATRFGVEQAVGAVRF